MSHMPEHSHDVTGWDLRTRLAATLEKLRPAEKQVATFLLEMGHQYSDFTLSDLAAKAGASQSAIVHMCQTLGLSGFREFRLRWVHESASRSAISQSKSVLFGSVISELLHTEQLLASKLARAAACIAQAKKVFLFGGGGSGLIAELGAEGLAVAGRMAFTFPSDESIAGSFFDTDTVVVVISHRGQNHLLCESLQLARNAGATSIVITGRPESPLASLADILLLTSTPGGKHLHPATSEVRTVQLAAVHSLVSAVGRQIRPGQTETRVYWTTVDPGENAQ